MNLIVAVDRNWGIGWQDKLLFRIREDMKRIKAMTTGKVVILGRKTLLTFPHGRPLPDRTNIILTGQADFQAEPALIAHNLDELAAIASRWPDDDLFVLGGDSVYRLLLPYCRRAFVTRVDITRPADRYFPDLDHLAGWSLVEEENVLLPGTVHILQDSPASDLAADLNCRFCLYEQRSPQVLRQI